jgi:hypothetical protein
MREIDTIVSNSLSSFLDSCLDELCCVRCRRGFKKGTHTANIAQVYKLKITTTLTGGVLCESCAKKFIKWMKRG